MDSVSKLSHGVQEDADSSLSTLPQAVLRTTRQHKIGLKNAAKDRYAKNMKREKKNQPDKNLNIDKEKHEARIPLPPFHLTFYRRRSIDEFRYLNMIAEGAYGAVYRARDETTKEIVALKRITTDSKDEGFFVAAVKELELLLKIQHPNVVAGREIAVGANLEEVFIVMDYVPHDLKSYMDTMRRNRQMFTPGHVKCIMTQLLSAVRHLHENLILHRDLKPSNILLSHDGVLKVADFGLARPFEFPIRQYTPIVVSLWYRAPELLLLSKKYYTPIDMWSVGCIFAELITMQPLFPGRSEYDQLNKIFKELGTPTDAVWPGFSALPPIKNNIMFDNYAPGGLCHRMPRDLLSEEGFSLLQDFLTYDPLRRVTADDALHHAYFKEQPVAIEPARFPTWPANSESSPLFAQ